MKTLKCCEPKCGKEAEFEIICTDSCNPEDYTHSCEKHVGKMLGSIIIENPKHWEIISIL